MNEIVAALLNHLNEDQREEWEERAAIMEYDGKLQRDHAECLALLDILRSNPEVLTANMRKGGDLI